MPSFYKETQRFTQWWLWALSLISTAPVVVIFLRGIYIQLIVGQPWGDNPMSGTGLVFMTLFIIAICGGLIALLISSELTIEIHNRTIYFRFPPFIGRMRRIGMDEIDAWEVKRYNPFREYGGYGWRSGFGKKTAYNVKGRVGLELKLKNGKTLMLGTQRPEEIKSVMENEWNKHLEY